MTPHMRQQLTPWFYVDCAAGACLEIGEWRIGTSRPNAAVANVK